MNSSMNVCRLLFTVLFGEVDILGLGTQSILCIAFGNSFSLF